MQGLILLARLDFIDLFLDLVSVICQLNELCAIWAVSLQVLVALLSPLMAGAQSQELPSPPF